MRLDAHHIPEDETIQGDLCIVGGGPAGITLARELGVDNARVILLESGGIDREDSAQSLNAGEVIGSPYAGLQATRHRQLGGTAQTWNTPLNGSIGAKYVPLDETDFLVRPAIANSGWPFDLDRLQGDYRRAQEICGLGRMDYDGDHWVEHDTTFPLSGTPLRRSLYQFGPASAFTGATLESIGTSENVKIIIHATACGITMDGGTVTAVEAASLTGKRFRIRARLFVLAAGAIENARLLLASREPGREAPGDEHGWLGRCFMEHPRDQTVSLIVNHRSVFSRSAFYDRHHAADGTLICGRMGIAAETLLDRDLPNASLTLLPLPGPMSPPGPVGSIGLRLRRLLRRQPPSGYGWSESGEPWKHYRGFRILINMEQFPDRENRVMLGKRRDPLGVPRAEIHWQWRDRDQAGLTRLRSLVCDSLAALGIGRVESHGDSMPDPNAHHHAGTTRMHLDPRYGVVDSDGRVHGSVNLYVTGSSVFPTSGFANPTLTVIALGVRLAAHLRQRL